MTDETESNNSSAPENGFVNFYERNSVSTSIHERAAWSCKEFVHAVKLSIAYPSLKDRIMIALAEGERDAKKRQDKIDQYIDAITDLKYEPPKLQNNKTTSGSSAIISSLNHTKAIEAVGSALKGQENNQTRLIRESAESKIEHFANLLKENGGFKDLSSDHPAEKEEWHRLSDSIVVERDFKIESIPRTRMRWDFFNYDHSFQLTQDTSEFKDGSDEIPLDVILKWDPFSATSGLLVDAGILKPGSNEGESSDEPKNEEVCDCANGWKCKDRYLDGERQKGGNHENCKRRACRAELLKILTDFQEASAPENSTAQGTGKADLAAAGVLSCTFIWVVPFDYAFKQLKINVNNTGDSLQFLRGLHSMKQGNLTKRIEEIKSCIKNPKYRKEFDLRDRILDCIYNEFKDILETVNKGDEHPRSTDIGADDYVFSFLNDKRAILFADLRPSNLRVSRERKFSLRNKHGIMFEDRHSTKIVLDLGMNDYERGRLIQRLMDVSNHRALALRNHANAKAAHKGVTRIGRQMSEAIAENLPDKKMLNLKTALIRLNLFFTLGIPGRAANSEKFRRSVRRNLFLLREERISGYQSLGGYMERFHRTARELKTLAMRYNEVLNRIDQTLYSQQIRWTKRMLWFAIAAVIVSSIATFDSIISVFSD